ncbi:MAG: glycosyltransferase [Bacteroidales bacterium]|jgi:sugar transferase (PEP-CTERM/EpsH1 system associated)|nr:glycosyltransferase [Bacteroidales bacterium]
MKIFVLLSRIPWPLEKGDKLRAFNQLKELSKQHEIVLCALNSDRKTDKQAAFRALQPYCKSINFVDLPAIGIFINLMTAWLNGRPLQTGYFYNARAANTVSKLIEQHQPDMLYGQLLRVAEYLRYERIPKTLDYQDVFSMGMKRRLDIASWLMKPFLMTEYKRLQRYESEVFEDFDLKTIISEPDRDLIPHPKRAEILVIPNGVDHDYFKPMKAEKKYDIVFTGNMAYPPNVNAATFLAYDIMPIIWKSIPDAKLFLAGATPDASVRQTASKRIVVSGWMDDIRQAYAGSKVFVAPMRIGTGLQNKLLEAMAMELPCVTTPLANKPLKAQHRHEILIGEKAEEIAAEIVSLLQNQEQAAAIAKQGKAFVTQKYNWEMATNILADAMLGVVKR